MPNEDASAVIDATGEPIPLIAQIRFQFLVKSRREQINELDSLNCGVNRSFSLLEKVKNVALQFKQRNAERSGGANAVVYILLDDLKEFKRLRVSFRTFKFICRSKLAVNVTAR